MASPQCAAPQRAAPQRLTVKVTLVRQNMQGTHSSEDFLGILPVARAEIRRDVGGCGDDGGKLWQRPQQKLVPGIAPTIPKAEVLRTREGAGAWKPRNIRRDRHYAP